MATLGELNIQIAANVAQLSQDVTKVEREMRKMRNAGVKASKQMDGAAKSITGFKNLAVGVGAVIVAWRTLDRVVGSSMAAFAAQEDAEKKLEASIGGVNKGLLEQAAALQKVSKFGDETIIEAQALIGAFVKDEKQIKLATKATLDLAAAKGMDLKAAADLVAKSLGSSTNALSRYGIQITGAVGSTERLNSAVDNISALFGGQAAAQAETMAGRIQQMKNAFGDLQERIVKIAAPAITSFAEKMTALIEKTEEWGESLRTTKEKLIAFTDVKFEESVGFFSRMVTALENAIKPLRDLGTTLGFEGDPLAKSGVGKQDPGQKARQEAEARQAAIAKAKAENDARQKAAAQGRAAELQERISQNAAFIEEEQKLWEKELELESLNNAASEKFHQRQMKRKQDELDAEMKLKHERQRAVSALVGGLSAALQASTKSFQAKKNIAIAEALINTYVAISQASTATSNYYVNLALAAAAAASGFARVSAIRSQQPGGGGSSGDPGGGGAVASLPSQMSNSLLNDSPRRGETTIVFQGGTFIGADKDQVARDLAPAIEQALNDGVS